MKKLFLILCVLGVLFGVDNKGLVKQGKEAYNKREYNKALKLYKQACDVKDLDGCIFLGLMYAKGEGARRSEDLALKSFKKACNPKELIIYTCGYMIEVGNEYLAKQDSENGKIAAVIFQSTCEQGFGFGCSSLGHMYANGLGVKQDGQKAIGFYKKACEGGNSLDEIKDTTGCFNLGVMYADGIGIKQDDFKAVEFYQKACSEKVIVGCNNLGMMYAMGRGVKQDRFKAVELFKKVCDENNALGCCNLGLMYEKGYGIKQDKKMAKEYYGKACDLKDSNGCQNYARLNEAGY